jgi:hypothetical protein
LTQRIVDLYAHETDRRYDAQHDENKRTEGPVSQRKESNALNSQREIARFDGAWRLSRNTVRWWNTRH